MDLRLLRCHQVGAKLINLVPDKMDDEDGFKCANNSDVSNVVKEVSGFEPSRWPLMF